MKKYFRFFGLFLLLNFLCVLYSFSENLQSSTNFTIVQPNAISTLCFDLNEEPVAQKAIEMFRGDVLEITGKQLPLINILPEDGNVIVAGTLGKSKIIKQIIKQYRLKTDSVQGKWEAFSIQVVSRPHGNLLVVIGSDRRGTAYGILELSRMMGISPWIWWADVKPVKKAEIVLSIANLICQKPSVQYRGIFLNDEDWGLKPWASKTLDPKTGEIGPKTYSKIFELLLRLRANTIWPAMHECTTPFYFVKGNAAIADSFGIIVSTSHCEPLMRSNPLEWNHKTLGDYNFFTNKDKVVDYWNERLKDVGKYENIYTVGMRGIHDGAMEGAKNVQQQVAGLTDVFNVQRKLLTNNLHKTPEEIPQIFIPYKEVLDAYNAGLKVPEDVTLVWCDDNYGYLTRLCNKEEQKRSGGSGVYYHVSYWGRPHDYLWLATTQPSLIWTEMQKAWAYGARKIWILNVGDIKPAEYITEFYLDMAWNIDTVKSDMISKHLENWMGKTFGAENAVKLQNIMDEYYRLAFIRKPEFMGWSQTEPNTTVRNSDLNIAEITTRLKQYDTIEQKTIEIEKTIPTNLKNAYFELIRYPVSGAAEMNKKLLNWQCANLYAPFLSKEAETAKHKSLAAYAKIQSLTMYYNDSIEAGKWKLMMSFQPRKLQVFDKPVFSEPTTETLKVMTVNDSIALGVYNGAIDRKDDYIRLKASEFTQNNSTAFCRWQTIKGLGYSQSSMALQPFGAKLSTNYIENPSLEYEFAAKGDSSIIYLYLLPTHPIDASNNMRIAISIDGADPMIFNINTVGRSNTWKENVLRNQAVVKLPYHFVTGKHLLKIFAVDPDVVIDQLLIDFKPGRKFYGVGE